MKCSSCGESGVAFGCKSCVSCLEKAKQRSAKRYETRKLERKCKNCDGNCEKGSYCESCRNKKHKRYSNRKKQGLCVVCGKDKAGKTQKCERCHQQYLENTQTKRDERLSGGKCRFCDEPRVGSTLCLKHYLQFTAKTHLHTSKRYKELEDLFREQKGKCPYTGKLLTLGVDTSLDHIIPKSRGGSEEISNLQWVYYQVNFMKQDMLNQEFISLVQLISETYKPSS